MEPSLGGCAGCVPVGELGHSARGDPKDCVRDHDGVLQEGRSACLLQAFGPKDEWTGDHGSAPMRYALRDPVRFAVTRY